MSKSPSKASKKPVAKKSSAKKVLSQKVQAARVAAAAAAGCKDPEQVIAAHDEQAGRVPNEPALAGASEVIDPAAPSDSGDNAPPPASEESASDLPTDEVVAAAASSADLELHRLADFLLASFPERIVADKSAVDVAIELLIEFSDPSRVPAASEEAVAESAAKGKGRKLPKFHHGEIQIVARVPGYVPEGVRCFDPLRTDAAKRARLLDDCIDELADQLK